MNELIKQLPYTQILIFISCCCCCCCCCCHCRHCHITHSDIYDTIRYSYTRTIWKVGGLVAVRHCYAEGGSDCYAKLHW